jgi:hypothetical protein
MFESSLLGPQETGNRTVTLCASEVQQGRQFRGWVVNGGLGLRNECCY